MPNPIPANEDIRLAYLNELAILDTTSEPAFDSLVAIAGQFFDVPIALISLVADKRQWFKAKRGLNVCETDREVAFCAHAIMSDEVLIVEDALDDERFCNNPLVIGEPNIRFYAGAPLITENGLRLGTFCIIDTEPRKLEPMQIAILKEMAVQAMALIAMHDFARRARAKAKKIALIKKELTLDQLIIENMSEGMSYQDKNANVISVNPSACKILGLTAEEYINQSLRHENWRVTDETGRNLCADEFPAMICLSTGVAINNVTLGVEKPDGDKAWIKVSAQPVFEEGDLIPIGVVTTFSDVTEAKALEGELRIKTNDAEVANKTKSKFLANMSHEIRTPLNGVIGLASLLEKTNLDVKQREMIELMLSSGRSLERLLSDILDLSKVDAGQITLEEMPFNLTKAISDVVEVLRYSANEKGLEVNFNIEIDETLEIMGDALRLKQIISNLASNAIKFTDKGHVSLDIKLLSPESLEIRVNDTGIGMCTETLANVFKRFTQADASISRRFGGSGLGLSIAKGLVDIMGGSVSATSEPNVGTCFTIALPIKTAQSSSVIEQVEASQENVKAMANDLKILLVEDHLVNQKVFQMMMEPLGIDVVIANNGLEGVEAFKAQKFDVVFMDIQMPVMDGLEATRLIRDIERRIKSCRTPIIALSANAGKNHIEVAMNSGADDYLTKPIDFMRLTEKISYFARAEDEVETSELKIG